MLLNRIIILSHYLLIIGLLLLCNCTNTDKNILTDYVKNMPGEDLENLIGLEVKKNNNEKYTGHYQFYIDRDSKIILDGSFTFSFADSGHYFLDSLSNLIEDNYFWINKVKYFGTFKNNLREGKFIEEFINDDGVDLYSKWKVTIEFTKGRCSTGKFDGAIGYIMPETTYVFKKIDTCSFDRVAKLAWDTWSKEYNKK